ncbi:Aminoglycoside phosphotransferase [Penicillium expansum]|nr:Aminoglycoside phosphotransferase [Penicillium expansum]KGO65200.1 Aminoglycoside phosphotransferase [Penicillium expansum]
MRSSSQTNWRIFEGEILNLSWLAKVATNSVGAAQCISIRKYPDGMFNKTFLMTMEDGREFVAKVHNPNAGYPHFTTAGEASKFIDTPMPHVHTWNSQANSHPVEAEFIIMDKVEGVPLSQVWSTMQLQQRLKVIIAMTSLRKKWLSVLFSHNGSLYYAGDVQPLAGNHYIGWYSHQKVRSLLLARSLVETDFMRAEQIWTLTGDHKLIALSSYEKTVNALAPKDTPVTNQYPCLWHNDLHDDNIFTDPYNPERITGIIDRQSCHISPLFNHNLDPAFLGLDSLDPETLDLTPRLILAGLSPEEQSDAMREYSIRNVFIERRKLMQAKSPDLYGAVEVRKTAAYGLIFLSHSMFKYGEAHFLSLLVDLEDTWADLPGVTGEIPYPFDFSETDLERIKARYRLHGSRN